MTKRLLLLGCAIGAISGIAGISRAQTAAPAPSAADNNAVGEIVVTAQKRSETLQSVPVAVTAYTSKTRDVVGISGIQDYANFTPGMNYTNLDRVSIRGSGRQTYYIGNDPGVAQYLDGFYSASSAPLFETPLFVQQTEVLRGPQGTLFGRNSMGGAINITSRGPTDVFQGEVRASVGNYDETRFEGYVSGPITDGLRFMLGESHLDERDGYLKNTGSGSNGAIKGQTYYYGALGMDLGPNITANIRYQKAVWNDTFAVGDRLANQTSPYDTTSFFNNVSQLVPNPTYGYGVANPGVKDNYKFNTDSRGHGSLHGNNLISATVKWDLGFADLKYIVGFQNYTFDTGGDNDYSSRTAAYLSPVSGTAIFPRTTTDFLENKTYYSNELNLSSPSGGKLQWIVGLYQYHENYSQEVQQAMPDQPQLSVLAPLSFITPSTKEIPNACYFNPACLIANPSHDYIHYLAHLKSDAYAGFAQADYKISPDFKVTAGIRYSYDEKSGDETVRYALFNPDATYGYDTPDGTPYLPLVRNLAYAITNETQAHKANWSAVTGQFKAEWTPTSKDLVYASYARGYKSGGFLFGTNAGKIEANPEYVDAFEVGYKTTIANQLTVDASLFYNLYNGLQINFNELQPTGLTANDFLNLDARAYGLELETVWHPTHALQVILSYSYMNSEITQGCNVSTKTSCFVDPADPGATDKYAKAVKALAPYSGALEKLGTDKGFSSAMQQYQTLKGDQLPQSPKNKIALNVNYTWDFSPGSLTASASTVWQDEETSSVLNGSEYRIPSYDVTDFRLLWNDANKKYTVIAYVKNAFDTVAYGSSGSNGPTAVYAATTGPTDNLQRVGYNMYHGLIFPRTYGLELQYRF
ncbi:MAG: TonB-dependent receptor [Caulobacteraceae bacterium]|nr:TonB-dependent receptor [Caulobacteraceae bacterium]